MNRTGTIHQIRGWRAALAMTIFVAIAFLACVMPDTPGGIQPTRALRLPIEIPLLALALLLLPRRMAIAVALLATTLVFCLLFLKIGDLAVLSAFQRRFNPYLDLKMIFDGWNLLSGSVGTFTAAVSIGGAVASLAALVLAFSWACIRITNLSDQVRRTAVAVFALLLVAGVVLQAANVRAGSEPMGQLRVADYLGERLSLVARSVADIRAFEAELHEEAGYPAGAPSFERIKGRDLILVFIESYGRSAIEDLRYSPLIGPRLEGVEWQLSETGFASASGWTRSPTVAGLSWLAHGTFLSGLWTDSQARYDRLMASDRASLNRMFRDAGWRAVAVMPAITMDWPEAAYYGYDEILAAKDLGYRGKPFNWVTMPDQYTLSAFESLARSPARDAGVPVMAEIALISSHAPWTPIPRLVDWNSVGDGTIFDEQAESGDPPAVVWADQDRVRRHYIATIDYALETLGSYISRFGRDAVFVVLGDHQPAALITGPDASRSVPIHIVSRDHALVDSFKADGFSMGMTPSPQAPEPSMDRMRDVLISRFGGGQAD